MLAFVAVHLVVAGFLPALGRRSTRAAFWTAAIPPAVTLVWALFQVPGVLAGRELTHTVAWAPRIGLELSFRMDALALLMSVLVLGVGALVLIYSNSYFDAGSRAARRSAPLLLGFAGAMLGLVLSDHLITLYVFWELTTICSFLLVGQAGISRESRRSAMQALVITIFGGLAMLVGFVVLGESAGTYRISWIVEHPPTGPGIPLAAVLILIGAFTKSAQWPFHNWLPAAMVAPTPISAYLHAASMVKAGVFLVARLEPAFLQVPQWWVTAVVIGLATMIMGGWRALREYDLKRLLAYGTVSQLGFLMVLFAAGDRVSALAGAALLLAHGLFKASLFLVVGIIDHNAGTRDIRELSGLGKRAPWLLVMTILAAGSMAGLPPTLGFASKEAAFGAFAHGGTSALLTETGLVLGSLITVAYSLRLLWGAFATKPETSPSDWEPADAESFVPVVLPALGGLAFGLAYPLVDAWGSAYADALPGEESYHLALWHGVGTPLVLTVIALGGGVLVHLVGQRLIELRARLPKTWDAQRAYERIMALLERVAVGLTGRTQAGSLPLYLSIILLSVVAVPGVALVGASTLPQDIRLYDNPMEIPLSLIILIAAFAVLRSRRRLTAVLMVGVIGYGIGGLFVLTGGPDLALAQLLVETLTMVAFVLVLRRLPVRFTQTDSSRTLRWPRVLIAAAGGVFVTAATMLFSSAGPIPPEASQEIIARSESQAGAANVVNAILVDFRAFDTVGEISVLAVAATGVASLILASRVERRRRSTRYPLQSPSQQEVRE